MHIHVLRHIHVYMGLCIGSTHIIYILIYSHYNMIQTYYTTLNQASDMILLLELRRYHIASGIRNDILNVLS